MEGRARDFRLVHVIIYLAELKHPSNAIGGATRKLAKRVSCAFEGMCLRGESVG